MSEQNQYNQQNRQHMEMIMEHYREAIAMVDEEISRGPEQEVKVFAQKDIQMQYKDPPKIYSLLYKVKQGSAWLLLLRVISVIIQ